jgi:hypothetical protein
MAKALASKALLKSLEQEEDKLAELKRKRETIAASIHIPSVDVETVLDARSRINAALRRKDPERMRAILAAVVSEVRCDWSKRKDPAVSFSYFYEDYRKPIQVNMSAKESNEWRKAFGEVLEQKSLVVKAKRVTDAEVMAPVLSRMSITHNRAPLTFIPKWSITSAERAAQEVVEQIAEALG